MRRFIYPIYIFASILVILGLYGCTNKPKDISEEALTAYLEKKYNDTFTLKDRKEFSPHKGTDTLYTFESDSGIICHVSKEYSGGFLGYTYSYQEDYPTMYLREYPELIAELLEGDFEAERIDTDNNYCFESKYILYFESYKEIEIVLEYIDAFLEKAQAIPVSDYAIPDRKITQKRPDVTIGMKENNYQFGVYYHYPTEHFFDKESKNNFLEGAQDTYVGLVREGKLSETLSAEVLMKHPAPAIRNITFHDEPIIDSMVYRKEISEYVIDQSCIEYKDCPFYPDKLAALLKTLGWSPKIPYEDLRQEILTNLWLGLEQFRGTSKLSTWVYRVSVNSALMAIRNYKPKVETLPFEISDTDISSEADDNRTEQLAALHELINQLLPIEKAIILLWLDEYSYEEIADIIGIERNNVATKLHRIKNKLISKSK